MKLKIGSDSTCEEPVVTLSLDTSSCKSNGIVVYAKLEGSGCSRAALLRITPAGVYRLFSVPTNLGFDLDAGKLSIAKS